MPALLTHATLALIMAPRAARALSARACAPRLGRPR